VSDDPAGPIGLAVVDKPAGWTSHDVVARSRRLLGTRRVGHAGTLDPMATGVLVLGVGPATRLLTFLSGLDKTYEASVRFGVETDSLDADGTEVARWSGDPPDPGAVRRGAAALTGDLQQVPPMVSAVKVGGRRLHQLAREGKEVERAPRPVRVGRFEVEPTDDPWTWRASVSCSSGTYVRVLAADLGASLGCGAHLAALRRTSVGPFTLDEARPLEDLRLLPAAEVTRVLPGVTVDEATAGAIASGKVLDAERLAGPGEGPWAVLGPDGALLAVYQRHRAGTVKPALVLPAAAAR
jgi:tRNA pseudouridine55 synthase